MKELPVRRSHLKVKVDDEDYLWLLCCSIHIDPKGYPRVCSKTLNLPSPYRDWLLHMAITYKHGLWIVGMVTDHIDRDKLNNQKYNLRQATYKQSNLNRGTKPTPTNDTTRTTKTKNATINS